MKMDVKFDKQVAGARFSGGAMTVSVPVVEASVAPTFVNSPHIANDDPIAAVLGSAPPSDSLSLLAHALGKTAPTNQRSVSSSPFETDFGSSASNATVARTLSSQFVNKPNSSSKDISLTMASRSLYRSVLNSNSHSGINGSTPNNNSMDSASMLRRHHQRFLMDVSPMAGTLSPMSSLAFDLNSTNLSSSGGVATPCRRLSLSSNTSSMFMDEGESPVLRDCSALVATASNTTAAAAPASNLSSLSCNSYPPERRRKRRFAHHLSCSLEESIQASASAVLGDFQPLPSPTSPSSGASFIMLSPSPADDQENAPQGGRGPCSGNPQATPKTRGGLGLFSVNRRPRRSPLKDIANVSRSLCFNSPPKKAVTPAKKPRAVAEQSLSDTSPPDDPDANSRDSGYSGESATKCDDDRLRESVACAPRKLNLDTPTKVKLNRLNSLSSVNTGSSAGSWSQTTITVVPSMVATTTSSSSSVSPDSLLSHNSNFPTSSSSNSSVTTSSSVLERLTSVASSSISEDVERTSFSSSSSTATITSCPASCNSTDSNNPIVSARRTSSSSSSSGRGFALTSLLTEPSLAAGGDVHEKDVDDDVLEGDEEDVLCMQELSSLEEESLVDSEDESRSNGGLSSPPSVTMLGALLSRPVMDTSQHSLSSPFDKNCAAAAITATTSTASVTITCTSSAAEAVTAEARAEAAAKALLLQRHDTVEVTECLEVTSSTVGSDTLLVSTSSSSSSSSTTSAAAPSTPRHNNKASRRSRAGARRMGMLACNMDVSPYNPQTRPPIRRALSLVVGTPPQSSFVQRKNVLSPNYAFKRPLPPADITPVLDSKRHKAVAVGGTPTLPGARSVTNGHSDSPPIPILQFEESTPSPPKSCRVPIPMIMDHMETSDGSPELPLARPLYPNKEKSSSDSNSTTPCSSRIVKVQSPYNLGPRQYSVPVAPSPFNTERTPLVRTHSESHLSIMKALNSSTSRDEHLTGDFCQNLCLPVISGGRHPDMKSISSQTMADLINGKYSHTVASYQILDCRYPYEFAGGHIINAESWHNPQFVVDQIKQAESSAPPTTTDPNKRHILIFHCEFSAERGPKALRLLREKDRIANKDRYPSLHYPETYLLEGGYKVFFEQNPELCIPRKYTKMIDVEHAEQLKMCRSRSKTWATENKQAKGRKYLRSKSFIPE